MPEADPSVETAAPHFLLTRMAYLLEMLIVLYNSDGIQHLCMRNCQHSLHRSGFRCLERKFSEFVFQQKIKAKTWIATAGMISKE